MSARPLQNRVTPDGDIVACPERGTMLGNRGGRFHGADQRLGRRRWHSRQWICCVLAFKGRRRPVMAPRSYTELFFLDEAVALSAGHRPCFECRRAAATQFAELWNRCRDRSGRAAAGAMDDQLHGERLDANGGKPTWRARVADLPDGTFVRWPLLGTASGPATALLLAGRVRPWSWAGYGAGEAVPSEATVAVLTPRSIVAVLGAGYLPVLHSSVTGNTDMQH
jgi:hypothetical protein